VQHNAAYKLEVNPASIRSVQHEQPQPRRLSRTGELEAQVDLLIRTMRIAVVHGGNKDEDGAVIYRSHNPRSWKSYEYVARDIAKSLERLGASNVCILPDDMRLPEKLIERGIDMVWLNTAGVQGNASVAHTAAMLEMLGIPYVGHDPLVAAIMDSKHTFKRQMIGSGIPTARFMTWHAASGTFDAQTNERFHHVFGSYPGPFVVKPVSGRASLNVEYVETPAELGDRVNHIFEVTQNTVLIEQFLEGREFCVAACGPLVARNGRFERLDGPFTFAAIERALEPGEHIFTSMDKKPITGDRICLLDPCRDESLVRQLHNIARAVMRELNVSTLMRLDVRADENGQLFILECNPKPDLKAPSSNGVTSIIAASLEQCGMGYDDLIHSLIADRIDLLLSRQRGSIPHLLQLLSAA